MKQIPINEGNLVKTIICACVQVLPSVDGLQDRLLAYDELKAFTPGFLKKNIDQAVGIKRRSEKEMHQRTFLLAGSNCKSIYSETTFRLLVRTLESAECQSQTSFVREVGRNLGGWEAGIARIMRGWPAGLAGVSFDSDGLDTPDGHDSEGFPGGCGRFGCPGGDECTNVDQSVKEIIEKSDGDVMRDALQRLGSQEAVDAEVERLRDLAENAITNAQVKALTEEAEDEYAQFREYSDLYGGCRCHSNPPCSPCTHAGKPSNMLETDDYWQLVSVEEADDRTTFAEVEAAAS